MVRPLMRHLLAVLFLLGPTWAWAGDPVALDIQVLATGGVKATAVVSFPVEPEIIRQLLTDYAHWPDLFDTRMRMADICEQAGSVLTDVRIEHALLPGERRLLSESRMLPTGREIVKCCVRRSNQAAIS